MTFQPPELFNIADYFLDDRLRDGRGDRIALRLDDRDVTYAEVAEAANRHGNLLRRLGVRREERVLVCLPDGPDFVAAFFGILKIGAVVVMVNPHMGPESLARLIDYTGASFAVLSPETEAGFREAMARSTLQPGLLAAGGAVAGLPDTVSDSRDGDEVLEAEATHRDDPAIWLFSGGTTGLPKAVVQPHASFANTTELYAKAALGWCEDDVTLSVPKLFFGYATGSNLLFPFAVGGSAVLFPEHPTADVLFEKIRRHRPTILVNVPKMIQQMVGHDAATQQDLSCLRFATSAGEALPTPLYDRWRETFGVELLDGLGTAEMWHVFLSNLPGEVRPGTLGRAIPGFEIEVRDGEERPVPDGEVGRLWVRGGSRAVAYWRNMPRTMEAFRGEWFVGGDLVRRDADGYFTYCGRGDDVLKVGGKWLAPQELESCLMGHPAVGDCAVVGVTDEDGFTKPVAFVASDAEMSDHDLEEELKAWVLARLQPYKHPRRVIRLASLPRTHLGKTDRAALKKLA